MSTKGMFTNEDIERRYRFLYGCIECGNIEEEGGVRLQPDGMFLCPRHRDYFYSLNQYERLKKLIEWAGKIADLAFQPHMAESYRDLKKELERALKRYEAESMAPGP